MIANCSVKNLPKELAAWLKKYPTITAVKEEGRTDDATCFDFTCAVCKDSLFVMASTRESATFDYYNGFTNRKFQMEDCEWVIRCQCLGKTYDPPGSYEVRW